MTASAPAPRAESGTINRGILAKLWSALGVADEQVYFRLAEPTSPRFDRTISHLTNAADHSKLSLGMAAVMSVTGGTRGRRAALTGLAAVTITSTVANLVIKPLARRARPIRPETHRDHPPEAVHHVPMPESHSFPSGHTAAACAFATGVAHVWPQAALVPGVVAITVGYSRIHTGVHFPSDVLLGAITGIALGSATDHIVDRVAR